MEQGSSSLEEAVLQRVSELRVANISSPEQLDKLLVKELVTLIAFAHQNSPWWSERLPQLDGRFKGKSSQEILKSLPITNRAFYQDNFEQSMILNENQSEESLIFNSTSGSTGQPVKVLKDNPRYVVNFQAASTLDWIWHQRDPAARILAFRIDAEETNDAIFSPTRFLGKPTRGFLRDPGKYPVSALVDIILDLRPRYIISTLEHLKAAAQYAKVHEIQVNGIVEELIVFADPVFTQDRQLIFEVFGAKIVNRYSTEEVGYIAIQCPNDEHLHVITPNIIVEILDDQLEPCPIGVPGQVYLTQLQNYSMPIIRYQVGDMAEWAEPCHHSPWPVLGEIHGRVRDRRYLPDGSNFIPAIGRMKSIKDSNILEFQVFVLSDAIALVYRVREGESLSETHMHQIQTDIAQQFRTEDPVIFLNTSRVGWRSNHKKRTFEVLELTAEQLVDADSLLDRKTS